MSETQDSVTNGTTYPTERAVVAEINDPQEAHAAEQALRQAGFAQDDMTLFVGEQAAGEIHAKEEHSSPLERFARWFHSASGDEDVDHEARLQALREGHAILAVATPDDAAKKRAHDLLLRYHAHNIRAFDKFSITDLPAHPVDEAQL